jgi:hypothetical protein
MAMPRSLGRRSFTTTVIDGDGAAGDFFETGDHAQSGRLAAAGGADEDHEFTVGDFEVDALHRTERRIFSRCGIGLVEVLDGDGAHGRKV